MYVTWSAKKSAIRKHAATPWMSLSYVEGKVEWAGPMNEQFKPQLSRRRRENRG